jgi:drug/metabolite transporter (DMT)-like permease
VPLQQRYGALPVMFRVQLGALAMTAPFGLFGLGGSTFAWDSFAAVVALGVFGTGVAFVAMGTLLGRVGAARGSIAVYFVPVIALFAGVLFRDEHVAALSIVGMVLVIIGAALTSRSEAAASPPQAETTSRTAAVDGSSTTTSPRAPADS